MSRFVQEPIASVLLRQLFKWVILCVVLFSTLQGWLNYRAGEQKFETAVRSVAETHLPLLSVAIWDIEPQTIEKQMGLLLNSPDVAWVAIYTSTGKVFTQGSKENVSQSQTLRMDIPAPMASNGSVGTLELVLDKSSLRSELIRNLIIAVLEILVLALVLLFAVAKILKRDLEQPLHELAAYVRKLEANQLGAVFSLHRRKRHGYNEIDLVVDGFREMQNSLQRHIRDQDQLVLERTQQLETALATLKTLSNTDALTQVFNRQYFNEQMPAELTRALRYGRPVSVVFCDIDFFKQVNDTYGHAIGDRVLITFASLVRQSLYADRDWLARYGGEEFVIVLPETDLNAALERAEQIRKKVESDLQFFLEDGRHFSVTTSFGVAVMESADSVDTLMKRADLCLYEAKQNGRNQVRPALLRRTAAPVFQVHAPQVDGWQNSRGGADR